MICEYCNNEFVNNNALRNHQKNAAYCLKLRNEDNVIKCVFYNKRYSNHSIKKHIEKCKLEKCKLEIGNDINKMSNILNQQEISHQNEIKIFKDSLLFKDNEFLIKETEIRTKDEEIFNLKESLASKDEEINKLKNSLANKINENLQLDQQFTIKDNENFAYSKIAHQNELLIKEYETRTNILETFLKKYEEKLDQGDKEKIDAISKCINVLANKVGNTTNNTIKYSPSVNLILSPEYLQQKLELYDETHYSKGVAGVVEWAIEHVAPDIGYGCANIARGKFTFTTDGKGGVDMGGDKFKSAIHEHLLPHMKKYCQKRMAEINKSGKSDNKITEMLIAEADLFDENKDLKHFSTYLIRKVI